jgi:hypothetical protein
MFKGKAKLGNLLRCSDSRHIAQPFENLSSAGFLFVSIALTFADARTQKLNQDCEPIRSFTGAQRKSGGCFPTSPKLYLVLL